MARPISVVSLTFEQEQELRRRSQASTTSRRDGLRADIILLRAQGLREVDVASQLAVSLPCVSKWSKRFALTGLSGLVDKSGRGRKPSLPLAKVQQVISQATRPPAGRSRWSVRSMAKAVGISHDSVRRIWRDHDIKPHLTRTFKLSTDPLFEEKVTVQLKMARTQHRLTGWRKGDVACWPQGPDSGAWGRMGVPMTSL